MSLPHLSISVVIPAFNSASFLQRAIASCQAQSYAPTEIIIVDDASTDETPDLMALVQQDDPRIRYIRLSSGEGAQSARLKGVTESTGDWVLFLDADDELLADSIRVRVEVLGSCEQTALIYGDTYLGEAGKRLVQFKQLDGHSYSWLCKELSLCPYSCMMVRKQAFDVVGYPDAHFPSWQDDDMVLTIGRVFPVRHCGVPVTIMHRVSGSITSNCQRVAEGCRLIVKKYARDIVQHHGHFRLMLWRARVLRAYLLAFCQENLENRGKCIETAALRQSAAVARSVCYGALSYLADVLTHYLSRHFDHMYA
jgi:glycosyltransferase involved in cell wall biosynthesis